ncbi:hypothetical protein [Limosilactobacillus mucosae]|uniref:Uncharacterized protein n=1 Tax=Limosilactobacillus mucosae TaxID=97478 RepID=A0AAJ1HQT7_LIMMU|nr:hypothetical protein [Limosilactobacillus mucosae]MDC2828964.1 hypothetical protein [Limosilactobacillus mucosae]
MSLRHFEHANVLFGEETIKTAIKNRENNVIFDDPKKHTIIFPSLMDSEQEKKFNPEVNHKIGENSIYDSIKMVKKYSIIDEFKDVFLKLNNEEEYLLKFIAYFKSVQKLQLIRQFRIFFNYDAGKDLNKFLKNLVVNGLIQRWSYHNLVINRDCDFYTLTGNGFRFLRVMYNESYFYHPNSYFNNGHIMDHLRFWETVDIYQSLITFPAVKGITTWFNGDDAHRVKASPLQVAIQVSDNADNVIRFVFYPTLQNDNDKFYMKVIKQWNDFVDGGNEMEKPINNLPKGQTILTFYTATYKTAVRYTKELSLKDFNYPVVFMVGAGVKEYGIGKAFMSPRYDVPDEDSVDPNNWLEYIDFSSILK